MTGEGKIPQKEGSRRYRPYYSNPLSPVIKLSEQYHRERYWWCYRRLKYLVYVIKYRGVDNADEWMRLANICRRVSFRKKVYLYKQLSPLFSEASLDFLFSGFRPPTHKVMV